MAIKGSLREGGLADVCQLLAVGQKTGCLSVTDRARFGQIFFDHGRVLFATLVNRRDRIGDMLVRAGEITYEELTAALDAQSQRPETRLGELLVERGLIDHATLVGFLERQIEEAVYYLFTWDQGSFFFEPGRKPEPGQTLVSLNPESLLLEGARRVDEWNLIEKKVGSMDSVFAIAEDAANPQGALSEAERTVLEGVDGERTVEELAEATGLGVFETGQALYGLIQAGFVHRTGRREDAAEAAPGVDEARNLGVAFFRTGMLDEAGQAFAQVLDADPDDARASHYIALIALRQGDLDRAVRGLSGLIERGAGNLDVHLHLAYAYRKQRRVGPARRVLARARTIASGDPRVALAEGVTELFIGDVARAVPALEAHRERLDPDRLPPAPYYYCAGLAAAARGRTEEARRIVEEGVGAYPASAPLQLLAGALAERHGDHRTAEHHYRQATEGGGGLAQAHRNLGDLMARKGARREALDHYQHAAEIDPDLGDGLYTRLADLYYRDGQRGEAVRCWRRALELNPDNEVARNHLEVVARAEG